MIEGSLKHLLHLKRYLLSMSHRCRFLFFFFLEIVQQIVGADGLNVLINNAGMKLWDESQEVYLQTYKVSAASAISRISE